MLSASEDIKQKQNENGYCCSMFRSCVTVEVAVLGSPSLIVLTVSMDVKQHLTCHCCSEFRNCVKVEVAVQGFRSLIAKIMIQSLHL